MTLNEFRVIKAYMLFYYNEYYQVHRTPPSLSECLRDLTFRYYDHTLNTTEEDINTIIESIKKEYLSRS